MRLRVVWAAVAFAACAAMQADACSAIIIGKKASTTGRVIVGHNEDNGGRIAVRYGWVPPRDWPAGSVMKLEDGCAAVPQVARTEGFFWSELKKPTGCVTNADTFFNANGVLVVTDNAIKSSEGTSDPSRLSEGGVWYALRRAVAERAKSARDAAHIISELVEKYGYVPQGRIYTVADANEGWQVQVVSGKHYVAMRCPDDAICMTPNHYTIREIPDEPTDDCFYSPDLIQYAENKGWWEKGKRPFDFKAAYQAPDWMSRPINTERQSFAISQLLGRAWRDPKYPFCVKAERKVSPEDVMKVLSSHGEDVVPHDNDRDFKSICRAGTNESLVCDFGETPEESVLHIAAQPPCEHDYVAFKPLVKPLPAPFDDGRAVERFDSHFAPEPDLFPRPLVVGVSDRCSRPYKTQMDYVDALERAGHAAFIIGKTKDRERMAMLLSRIDVLLLPGGEDVVTQRYGESVAGSAPPNIERDDFETMLLEEAVRQRKPIFGVCRGLQMMNVFFGGSLYQDIPTTYTPPDGAARCEHNPNTSPHTGAPAHDVVIDKSSRLFSIVGTERLAVNSWHHQGVKKLAPGFRVSARATDGFVEAIESDEYPAAGVQFHPEASMVGRPMDSRYDLRALEEIYKNIGRLCGHSAD